MPYTKTSAFRTFDNGSTIRVFVSTKNSRGKVEVSIVRGDSPRNKSEGELIFQRTYSSGYRIPPEDVAEVEALLADKKEVKPSPEADQTSSFPRPSPETSWPREELKLQYMLANGSWVDCESRSEEFLDACLRNNGLDEEGNIVAKVNATRPVGLDQLVGALLEGQELRNHPEDWYSLCRSEIPVIKRQEALQAKQEDQQRARRDRLTGEACKIFLQVTYDQKDHAKQFGARWAPDLKMWYYPSQPGEYLPTELECYDSQRTLSEENDRRFSGTGLEWYDRDPE